MFSTMAAHAFLDFERDMVDGGLTPACVENDDEFVLAMIYIADCFTYGRLPDLETFNVERARSRMLDVLLMVLDFE